MASPFPCSPVIRECSSIATATIQQTLELSLVIKKSLGNKQLL